MIISVEKAKTQAKRRGLKLAEELTLLICHGLLHAKGFDDIEEKDRLQMRIQEFECLAKAL